MILENNQKSMRQMKSYNRPVNLLKSKVLKFLVFPCFFCAFAIQPANAHSKSGIMDDLTCQMGQSNREAHPAIRLIPEPVYMHVLSDDQVGGDHCDLSKGFVFQLENKASRSKKENKALKSLIAIMKGQLEETLGFNGIKGVVKAGVKQKSGDNHLIAIQLELNPKLSWQHGATDLNLKQSEEGYQLKVSSGTINIAARTSNGLYYGLQSLLQLISADNSHVIPALEIEDFPQYSWRGFMLDVSRHFYSVEEIKKLLDVMSRYKLNVFHWHLTDDQGWRLQIKRYPKLTSVGAWRQEIPGSVFFNKRPDTLKGKPYRYGGFYTQQQAKEIVRYAALRGITVIPEIELPGHSEAALAAYPAFSSSGRPQTVANSMGYPKGAVSEYNPGNPATFTFLENILDEVMDIFPSHYIHLGGDEVDKTNWKNNASCLALMKKEGLKNYEELQSYFINKIGDYLEQHGRRIICWDEALEGNLLPSATITYWRSWAKKAPLKAVSNGHPFINVCSDPLYLNRYQAGPEGEPLAAPHSMNTLERVYGYQMMPSGFTPAQQKLVLGGQAAIWTEFFGTNSGMEYMLLPRLLALAENLWSPEKAKDYPAFYQALPRELKMLGAGGYNYRQLVK